KSAKQAADVAQMEESRRVVHALNRLTFGPRPGDVARVDEMGVDKWIELQLHPEKIDNSALDARLSSFRTLNMSARQMIENFPPPQAVKRVADGRANLPSDPEKRAVYESAVDRYEQKKENKENKAPGKVNIGGFDDGQSASNSGDNKSTNNGDNKMTDDANAA